MPLHQKLLPFFAVTRAIPFLLLTAISIQLSAQADTLHAFNRVGLKRGFYKTYKEFIDNKPFLTDSFNVIPKMINEKDSTIICADYRFVTGGSIEGTWGFSDGTAVYVEYAPRSILKEWFWKLECTGPHPFFTYAHKDVYAIGPPVLAAATALASGTARAQYDLMVIDEKGKCKIATVTWMKKILAVRPQLLRAFSEEADQYEKFDSYYSEFDERESGKDYAAKMKIIRTYLVKLNEALSSK